MAKNLSYSKGNELILKKETTEKQLKKSKTFHKFKALQTDQTKEKDKIPIKQKMKLKKVKQVIDLKIL